MQSPLGPLLILGDEAGLRAIRFIEAEPGGGELDEAVEDAAALAPAIGQLREYFAGHRRAFDLPLAPRGTAFQRDAWAALQTVPFGETICYAEQARRMGRPNAVRAAGAANGRNPLPIVVPCHRVVASDGRLAGYSSGVEIKRWLLEHEGCRMRRDKSRA